MYLESESVLAENETWDQRARRSIGQGYLTNSKRPTSHIGGVYPTHIDSGCGAILKVGKKEYIDYICGLGTNLLGYNNSRVITAVSDALQIGASHSFPTTLEVKAAEAIKSVVHFVERVKFFKSGSDACSAAIKMARAYQQARGNLK